MEIIGLAGISAALVAAFVSSYFFGGRRWRNEYDAEHTRAERLQATLVEKDLVLSGASERLAKLDGVVQELGGERVAQTLAEMRREDLLMFKEIADSLTAHEQRAAERHAKTLQAMEAGYDHMAKVNEQGFDKVAKAFENGHGREKP